MRASKVLSPTDTGVSRTHQSGILIPKDERILRLFPRLDAMVTNPDRHIEVWVARLDMFWSARFVFYNTKDLGIGTRSEYRLTRIASLLRDLQAMPGDTLTLTRSARGDLALDVDSQVVSEEDTSVVVLKSGWTVEVR